MIKSLRQSVDARDLAGIDTALRHSEDFGLKAEELAEARQMKARIEKLFVQVKAATDARDPTALEVAIKLCRDAELPPTDVVTDAVSLKCKLDDVLAGLHLAMKQRNADGTRTAIRSCEAMGVPDMYTEDARGMLDELERLFAHLQQGMSNRKIETLRQAISACREYGIPDAEMEEAISTKASIEEILSSLSRATESRDMESLKSALLKHHEAGLPPSADLDEAMAMKRRVEQILAKLGVAVQLMDIRVLKAAIEECQSNGLPDQDLNEALLAKESIERMLATVRFSIDCKNMSGIEAAIKDCPIDLLRAALEECHAAEVPAHVLQSALRSRAAESSESDRRLIYDLGEDDEKRLAHNKAVNMLHESIRSGNDVPAEFEELINELIVNHVM